MFRSKIKYKSIVLCVAFYPDDTPPSFFEDSLKQVYTQALLLNKPIIILGDLNCIDLDSSCRAYAALDDFIYRHRRLSLKLQQQGYKYQQLTKSFHKFYRSHSDELKKFGTTLMELRSSI